MSSKVGALPGSQIKAVGRPRWLVLRFVAKRTVRAATFTALIVGAFIASKTIGYADIYPTAKERLAGASLLVNNSGYKALLGAPRHLADAAGLAVWYGIGMGILIGCIWAYLIATKTFRGEESSGRWEMLLTGQTTFRNATLQALLGIGLTLTLFYSVVAIMLVAVGADHVVEYSFGPALYFALAVVSGSFIFAAVGAFTSQIMPTRARAAGLATVIFVVFFLIRAAGNVTSAVWLLNITPLGWIDKLQPLYSPQPIWLIPIILFTLVVSASAVYLAGKRDLGGSFFADKDTAKPHTALLNGPLEAAIRLTRVSSAAWVIGLAALGAFFGALTYTAAQAFDQSATAQQYLAHMAGVSQETGAKVFLGIVFMLLMLVLMAYAASAAGAIRADEAEGYFDNLLVRSISRQRLLWGRIGLIVFVIVLGAVVSSSMVWVSMAGHRAGIGYGDLVTAGLNMLAPAIFTLGVGIAAIGFVPRLTTIFAYGIIAWSFLIQMISSGLNLSHWILDTSILSQVALAPASDPRWNVNLLLLLIGVVLMVLGAVALNNRDLASE